MNSTPYEIIRYPDGQVSLKVPNPNLHPVEFRCNSYEDLFILAKYAEALSNVGLRGNVVLSSLFEQRSDRRFDPTQSFDLKITCQFINSCNFTSVGIRDPHSDVSLALINNSYKISSLWAVQLAVKDILGE